MIHRRSFAFLLFATIAVLFSGCNPMKDSAAASNAVADFHSKLDAGDFKAIYSATHPDFKNASTEKDFVAILEAIHRKLGKIQSSERTSWNINSYNLKTNMRMTYKTRFAEGDATESFNYRIDGDQALLVGYNINSTALITK